VSHSRDALAKLLGELGADAESDVETSGVSATVITRTNVTN